MRMRKKSKSGASIFWTTLLVIALLVGGFFVTTEIIATNKGYKNCIEWMKTWDFKKKDSKEIAVDSADSAVTATILINN